MIERNLGNATDKQIKADQSLAKADYINMWHLPPLADPGPRRLAIQLALLSSLNCLSNLPATSLLRAASLACGEMTPIRESRH